MGCLPWGMGLDYIASLPLLPVSLWFFLYIFSCRSFLLFSVLFSAIVALQIVVTLVCQIYVGGGELRVFLLHHLGLNPRLFVNIFIEQNKMLVPYFDFQFFFFLIFLAYKIPKFGHHCSNYTQTS